MKCSALVLLVLVFAGCASRGSSADTYSVKVAIESDIIVGADPNGVLGARVTSDPPGIDCQATITGIGGSPHVTMTGACAMTMDRHGLSPALTITPDSNSALDHWTDATGLEDKRTTIGVPFMGDGQDSFEYRAVLIPRSTAH
jgi:hypothetical protein